MSRYRYANVTSSTLVNYERKDGRRDHLGVGYVSTQIDASQYEGPIVFRCWVAAEINCAPFINIGKRETERGLHRGTHVNKTNACLFVTLFVSM